MTAGVVGFVFSAAIFWVAPIVVGVSMGRSKRRAGWAYGFFLGWIGVIILALLSARPDPMVGECPYCREDMRKDASVCPHCQRDVTPALPAL